MGLGCVWFIINRFLIIEFGLKTLGYFGFQTFVDNVPKIHIKAKILAFFKRKNSKKDFRIHFSPLKAEKVRKIILKILKKIFLKTFLTFLIFVLIFTVIFCNFTENFET